jgi:hypothetical protein
MIGKPSGMRGNHILERFPGYLFPKEIPVTVLRGICKVSRHI